jgi:protein ImuB
MSTAEKTLYACVHAAEFPAQALLRLRTDLQSEPVAVMEGRAPLETVCALNRQARLMGVVLGMTRLEAEGMAGLKLAARSLEAEAAARVVMLECAASFSPRIEEASRGTACGCVLACCCVLDIAGTERLFGPPQTLAERLRAALAAAGFRASVAVSANFDAARLKAAATRGITVIAEGQEAGALAALPLAVLHLEEEYAETFAVWGIRTLGELAALPEVELVTRLGARSLAWRDLARGAQPHTLAPIEPEFTLREWCEFETPVEDMESLLFMGARMIDCMAARASARAMALASLHIQMRLAGGIDHRRAIRPAIPSVDRKFLLKLLQLEIAAHPPSAAVLSLALTAEAGQSSKVQLGLFAPQTPEPSRLDVTIARLKAIAGEDRVGSPVLEDTHRAGSFSIRDFAIAGAVGATKAERPRMALRRMRPPVPVRVMLLADRPAAFREPFREQAQNYVVTSAYGPWRSSGCWWSAEGWDAEEWDVLAEAANGAAVACLLVRDCVRNDWRIEAWYD